MILRKWSAEDDAAMMAYAIGLGRRTRPPPFHLDPTRTDIQADHDDAIDNREWSKA